MKYQDLPAWATKLFYSTAKNAAARKIDFNLSEQDFCDMYERAKGKCELTGIVFSHDRFEGSLKRPYAPSIDRIHSSGGYSAENCRLVCCSVNLAMNEWGEEVLREIAFGLLYGHSPLEIPKKDGAKHLPGVKKRAAGYAARIRIGSEEVHLGTFSTEQAAHDAYVAARMRLMDANMLKKPGRTKQPGKYDSIIFGGTFGGAPRE